MTDWTARRILREIASSEQRREVLTAFWKQADEHARHAALAHLAKSLHFREQTLRKSPPEKKADLLASRLGASELEESFAIALMIYHTAQARDLMIAFLDRWGVPHENGVIESDEYAVPNARAVESAVEEMRQTIPLRRILLYLASAGLLMGDGLPAWRDATWPVVDRLAPSLGDESAP
jgi:KaiC/GvpD/RAD55 family RecA-like ATPase